MLPTSYIAIDTIEHRHLAILPDDTFSHASSFNLVNLGFNEIANIAGCMPVVVVPNKQGIATTLAAAVGWPEYGNVFCSQEQWLGHTVPLSIQTYPFNYALKEQAITVLIDPLAERICDRSTPNAQPLFAHDGTPTATLKKYQNMLTTLATGAQQAAVFINTLIELELLIPLTINLHFSDGETRESSGLLTINESKLIHLDRDTVYKLHTQGMLVAINAMMISLRQYNRLVQLTQTFNNPVVKVSMKTTN